MFVYASEEQIGQLSISVDTHRNNAEDIAERIFDNNALLAQCRQSLEMALLAQKSFDDDISRLDEALSILESPKPDFKAAFKALDGWGSLVVDDRLLPSVSLARQGLVRSPEDILDQLVSPEELDKLRAYLDRDAFERLRWTKGDYIVCGACVLVGLALEILNLAWQHKSPIDPQGTLNQWFNQNIHDKFLHPDSPIDYQGPGFGGPFHRARSQGHDLARFFEAINQTMNGEFKGTRWSYGTPYEVISKVNQFGKPYPELPWTAAFVNVLVHLFADFFSTHSLPLPLTSVVYDNVGREFRKFVHDLYQGGFHLRHVAVGGIEVLLSYTAVEVWLWMQHGSEGRKTDPVSLKRYEMRAAVTGFLSGANIGGCLLFQNPFLLNVPVLVSAIDSSIRVLNLRRKQQSWIYKEIRNLDELFVSWNELAAAGAQ